MSAATISFLDLPLYYLYYLIASQYCYQIAIAYGWRSITSGML